MPGRSGEPFPPSACCTKFWLYVLALSIVAASPPADGHSDSPMMNRTSGPYPSFVMAEITVSTCASNKFLYVIPDPESRVEGAGIAKGVVDVDDCGVGNISEVRVDVDHDSGVCPFQEVEDGAHDGGVAERPCGGRESLDDVEGMGCGDSLVEAERSESRVDVFHGWQELGGVVGGVRQPLVPDHDSVDEVHERLHELLDSTGGDLLAVGNAHEDVVRHRDGDLDSLVREFT